MMGIATSINSWRTWRTPHWEQIKCSFGICIIPGRPRWKHWYQIKCSFSVWKIPAGRPVPAKVPTTLPPGLQLLYLLYLTFHWRWKSRWHLLDHKMKVSDNFQMRTILTSERNPVRVGINILVVVTWKQASVKNYIFGFLTSTFCWNWRPNPELWCKNLSVNFASVEMVVQELLEKVKT